MRVCQLVEQLQDEVDSLLSAVPFRHRKLADQLERAAESIGLNLSEGLTAYKAKAKASCFDIARREAGELRKAQRRLVRKEAVPPSLSYKSDALANAFIAAMTRMIKQQEEREADG